MPHFPTPEGQSHEIWCKEIQSQVPFTFDNDTILIGHSLGATFILDILDRKRKEPVKKAVLVSGFTHKLGNPEFDELNKSFLKNRNREQITQNSENFIILH